MYLIWVQIILYAQPSCVRKWTLPVINSQVVKPSTTANPLWKSLRLIWESGLLSCWCGASLLCPCFFLELHFLCSWHSVHFSPTVHGVTVDQKDADHWLGDWLWSWTPHDCSRSAHPIQWPLLPHIGLCQWLSGKESVCQCRRCKRCRFDPLEKETTPVFLPGKSGQRSLAGYSPWGCKEFNTTEQLTGLPWRLSWQRIHLQCGRPVLDPWVG